MAADTRLATEVVLSEFKSFWKPEKTEKKKPKYIKVKTDYQWTKTRNEFLKGKANHAGLYTCELCGGYTDAPEVDHIQTRGARPDLKHDPKNLRICCFTCHKIRHGQISRQS